MVTDVTMTDASEAEPLSAEQAEEMLDGLPLVPCLAGNLPEMKVIRDRCLAAGIPALVGCPSGGKSCGTRTHLMVEQDDIPRIAELLKDDWAAELAREGLTASPAPVEVADGEEPPCPACGFAGALVNGACADCGLVLE